MKHELNHTKQRDQALVTNKIIFSVAYTNKKRNLLNVHYYKTVEKIKVVLIFFKLEIYLLGLTLCLFF